jgi:hypothetical protein
MIGFCLVAENLDDLQSLTQHVGLEYIDSKKKEEIEFLSCSAHARMRHWASWSLTRFQGRRQVE